MLERTDVKDGYLILSKKQRRRRAGHRPPGEGLRPADTVVSGKVVERTRAASPSTSASPPSCPNPTPTSGTVKDPATLIGQTFKFKVIKFDRKSRERRPLPQALPPWTSGRRRSGRSSATWPRARSSPGHVRSLTNFGAFVDIGGVEGLLHVSDMSWGKIGHPSELLKVGQEIEVVVLDFNEKDEKISLGLKQLTPDPWANIAEKYQAGQKITGKVSSLTDFGAFVELEKGVEGLVHISDLTWSRKLIHPKKLLSPGRGGRR